MLSPFHVLDNVCALFVLGPDYRAIVSYLSPPQSQSSLAQRCSVVLSGQQDNTKPSSKQHQGLPDSTQRPKLLSSSSKTVYIHFMKLERQDKHWEENKEPFFTELEYQGEGENKKTSHHVCAGSAVVLQLLAALRPCSKESWYESPRVLPRANSAVLVKIAITKLHSKSSTQSQMIWNVPPGKHTEVANHELFHSIWYLLATKYIC